MCRSIRNCETKRQEILLDGVEAQNASNYHHLKAINRSILIDFIKLTDIE